MLRAGYLSNQLEQKYESAVKSNSKAGATSAFEMSQDGDNAQGLRIKIHKKQFATENQQSIAQSFRYPAIHKSQT